MKRFILIILVVSVLIVTVFAEESVVIKRENTHFRQARLLLSTDWDVAERRPSRCCGNSIGLVESSVGWANRLDFRKCGYCE